MSKSKKKRQANGRVITAEAFVRSWARGGTIADVAQRAGMSMPAAVARGIRFRKSGVNLPKLERRVTRRIDVGLLNSILKSAR